MKLDSAIFLHMGHGVLGVWWSWKHNLVMQRFPPRGDYQMLSLSSRVASRSYSLSMLPHTTPGFLCSPQAASVKWAQTLGTKYSEKSLARGSRTCFSNLAWTTIYLATREECIIVS